MPTGEGGLLRSGSLTARRIRTWCTASSEQDQVLAGELDLDLGLFVRLHRLAGVVAQHDLLGIGRVIVVPGVGLAAGGVVGEGGAARAALVAHGDLALVAGYLAGLRNGQGARHGVL